LDLSLEKLSGVPVFKIKSKELFWERALGGIHDEKNGFWLFPAYQPLLPYVAADLKVLCSSSETKDFIDSYVSQQPTYADILEKVKESHFPIESFDHQIEGTAELLHNYRWALRWDMGTGKTKVVIDTLRFLKEKALVLCPPIAVDNWAEEIEKHGGGELRTLTLPKSTRKATLNSLAKTEDYDVIVASFDTVKYLAIPQLIGKAKTWLKSREAVKGRPLSAPANKVIRRVNDSEIQLRFVQDFVLHGRRIKDIDDEINALGLPKISWLKQHPFSVIVADESHRLKTVDSVRSKAIIELTHGRSRRYTLSGSYAQGDPRDVYTQLRFLSPAFMPIDYHKYCLRHLEKNGKIVVGFKNLHLINNVVQRYSSERKIEECVTLPPRTFIVRRVTASKELAAAYNALIKDGQVELNGIPIIAANGADRLAKMFQACSGFLYASRNTLSCDTCTPKQMNLCIDAGTYPGESGCIRAIPEEETRRVHKLPTNPKLEAFKELIEDLVSSQNEKVIVWANYTQEIDDVSSLLSSLNIRHVKVTGSTADKKACEKDFQDGNAMVYLGQLKTGISVTLTAAAYTIFYSRSWVPEEREQPLGRNYRIGQNRKSIVIDLCVRGSVELQQLRALKNREEITTLLTKKFDCVLCARYSVCYEDGTMPWTENCVLSPNHEKHRTFPGLLG